HAGSSTPSRPAGASAGSTRSRAARSSRSGKRRALRRKSARASAWTRADFRVGRDAGAAPRPRRVGTTPASARRRGELARVEESVAIHVLLAEPLGKTREMLPARQRRALAAGLLIRRQHAIAIAVHAIEGIAHPGLVFG